MDTSLAGRKHATEFTLGPHRWLRNLDKVLLTILFIGLGIVFLIPFYWMVISSIRSPERIFADARNLIPTEVTLISYQNLFSELIFEQWYLNSIIIAFGFAILAVTLYNGPQNLDTKKRKKCPIMEK